MSTAKVETKVWIADCTEGGTAFQRSLIEPTSFVVVKPAVDASCAATEGSDDPLEIVVSSGMVIGVKFLEYASLR